MRVAHTLQVEPGLGQSFTNEIGEMYSGCGEALEDEREAAWALGSAALCVQPAGFR